VVASVGILGPAFRIPDQKVPALAKLVMRSAGEISFELGYRKGELVYRKSDGSGDRAIKSAPPRTIKLASGNARMGAYA